MAATIKVDKEGVMSAVRALQGDIADRTAMLRICGELMRTSIAYTFREEGSPAGSWPELAASTKKNKRYTSGHKLLVLTSRLRNSITYNVGEDVLTIGTDVVYAAVQQYGSRDYMGGAAGPRTEAMMSSIAAHASTRVSKFRRYGKEARVGKDGKTRMVRVRAQGPDTASRFGVQAHSRRQNIPARPFLVFRPEDPQRMTLGIESYLRGAAVRIGRVDGSIPGGGA